MYRSWDTDSDEEAAMPQDLYQKIREKLGEANEIISVDKKPDQEMPKLKLVIPPPPPPVVKIEEKLRLPPPETMKLENVNLNLIKAPGNKWDTLLNHFEDREKDLLYMRSDNRGEMKLETDSKSVNYFTGYFQDISARNLKRENKVLEAISPNPHQKRRAFFTANYPVVFDSCFESGNLFAAFKAGSKNNEFDLVMQNDINSRGNTQWFYFKCRLPKGTFKFNIINYTKNDSLFNTGMKVSVLSPHSKGWVRECDSISYQPSSVNRENSTKQYYTLSFQYTNFHDSNPVTFANCYPLTYSDVLNRCQKHLNKKVTKIPICTTYAGLEVFALRIGELRGETCTNSFGNNRVKKKSLVFMARQHPGESPASLVMDGIFDSLFTYKEFDILKKMFVVYLIPMINPDGVVYGNYRTNLSGADLNRKWRHPSRHLHPEVYYTRRFLSEIHRQNPIQMILDLHGHSKKLGSFFYGNPSTDHGLDNRMFPYLCSLRSNKISYADSTFSISDDKKNTARVVLNEMFPQTLVYTFEVSFAGNSLDGAYQQFTINEYKSIGKSLLESFTELVSFKKEQNSLQQNIISQLSLSSKQCKDDSGSDSEPQENVLEEMSIANKSNSQTLFHDSSSRAKQLIIKKNVVLKKGMIQPKHTGITMVDKSTQTQRKYFSNQKDQMIERRSQNKSMKQSQAVLRILQLKSISPDKQILLPEPKKPYSNQKKWETKKVKVFGSSFTMKLWNKGSSNLSFENKNENEVEFYKIISKGKGQSN